MEQKMFCYQCQETAGCKGCTACGVCGKQPEVAVMQDLLVYVTKGLSAVTTQLRAEGKTVDKTVNHLISVNLFITITNAVKEELLGQVQNKESLPEAALWNGSDYAEKAKTVGVLATENEDIRSLRELITYGLKGLAAYTKHANALLNDDEELDAFYSRLLLKHLMTVCRSMTLWLSRWKSASTAFRVWLTLMLQILQHTAILRSRQLISVSAKILQY